MSTPGQEIASILATSIEASRIGTIRGAGIPSSASAAFSSIVLRVYCTHGNRTLRHIPGFTFNETIKVDHAIDAVVVCSNVYVPVRQEGPIEQSNQHIGLVGNHQDNWERTQV